MVNPGDGLAEDVSNGNWVHFAPFDDGGGVSGNDFLDD